MNQEFYKSMLLSAKDQRINEITEYQVNIDSFQLALKLIGDDQDLQEFKANVEHLLASNILEQKKSKIMHQVAITRLEELGL